MPGIAARRRRQYSRRQSAAAIGGDDAATSSGNVLSFGYLPPMSRSAWRSPIPRRPASLRRSRPSPRSTQRDRLWLGRGHRGGGRRLRFGYDLGHDRHRLWRRHRRRGDGHHQRAGQRRRRALRRYHRLFDRRTCSISAASSPIRRSITPSRRPYRQCRVGGAGLRQCVDPDRRRAGRPECSRRRRRAHRSRHSRLGLDPICRRLDRDRAVAGRLELGPVAKIRARRLSGAGLEFPAGAAVERSEHHRRGIGVQLHGAAAVAHRSLSATNSAERQRPHHRLPTRRHRRRRRRSTAARAQPTCRM